MTVVVNLFGGPGIGKSTTAAGVFHRLKRAGFRAELVTEFAKDKVWGDHSEALRDQIYMFANQHHRMFVLEDKVEVIITDSPVLLSLHYGKDNTSDAFKKLVNETHSNMDTLNFFLQRGDGHPFVQSGRIQNLEESVSIDLSLKSLLLSNRVSFKEIGDQNDPVDQIFEDIRWELTK